MLISSASNPSDRFYIYDIGTGLDPVDAYDPFPTAYPMVKKESLLYFQHTCLAVCLKFLILRNKTPKNTKNKNTNKENKT